MASRLIANLINLAVKTLLVRKLNEPKRWHLLSVSPQSGSQLQDIMKDKLKIIAGIIAAIALLALYIALRIFRYEL